MSRLSLLLLPLLAGVVVAQIPGKPPKNGNYTKKGTRTETAVATLESFGLPTLEGEWYFAGPFDNTDKAGFDKVYPPEKGVDLKAEFTGKNGAKFGWKKLPNFRLGQVYNLAPLFPGVRNDAVVYLAHVFESPIPFRFPISLGSDDTLSVFDNSTRVVHEDYSRPAAADQNSALLKVKKGKNQLVVKIGQYAGEWQVYVAPELPDYLPAKIVTRYAKDFPRKSSGSTGTVGDEGLYYQTKTFPLADDCVLEVGGLAFRPDGKLLACTRRGDVWLIDNPGADDPADATFTRFATGLHEALGMHVVDDSTVYVVQRPEVTKLVDRDGDGTADEFTTICDKWGVSGDYHEYAFGPAVDADGNFYVTLNVGFGGGHQAKAAWRGWCVKIDPKTGTLEKFAYGLRSPNGVNVSPDGNLFYADNQGEWVATNKIHHITKGAFFGHQASLKWLKDSPFAENSDTVPSEMTYDGRKFDRKTNTVLEAKSGLPKLSPPAIWFPYGKMGQSLSEPIWDTTGGKFGPFAGQCFAGDQTRSVVMRIAMEKVNGVYQGACFPFVGGLQCGVNRLAFGPDGSLYAGQTNRGWGSVGGKPYGLQRITWTGDVPFEVHHVALTADGFDLTFTRPVDPGTVTPDAIASKSHTYVYFSNYGSPEVDQRAEKISKVSLSPDGKTVSVSGPDLAPGRVYEFRTDGIKSADGTPVLHPEAYYTLNELVK